MKTPILFLILTTVMINVAAQSRTELGAEYIRSMGKGYNHAKAAVRGESFNGSKNSFSAGITYQLGSKKAYSDSHRHRKKILCSPLIGFWKDIQIQQRLSFTG